MQKFFINVLAFLYTRVYVCVMNDVNGVSCDKTIKTLCLKNIFNGLHNKYIRKIWIVFALIITNEKASSYH
jgi:hypothetical protein